MSNTKSPKELREHKNNAVQKLDNYLENLISSSDIKNMGKSDKLSYWLEDWINFLDFETTFSPIRLRRYKRGEIIKVHLGFNVGSEEGGLHYAVVLDKNNPKSSPVVTIIPLTSVKPTTDLSNLKSGNIFLGNELFVNLNQKMASIQKHASEELNDLTEFSKNITEETPLDERTNVLERIKSLKNEIKLFENIRREIQKMRSGSIALVNQVTTVSKIRIYDPKTDHDILSGIKLSNDNLDLIDEEIRKKFTNI